MTRYFMPAEWETHAATILAWPHNREDWPGKFDPIPWVYSEIVTYLTRVERVRLLVKNDKQKAQAKAMCEKTGANLKNIDFYVIPTNRVWMRDSGPIVVRDARAKKTLLDWRFNAWAKYPNHKLDDKVPQLLNKHFKLPVVQPVHKGKRVVLEGGSIDVNGKGLLLTTEECLLSNVQERNPGFTRADYEEVFHKYLGIDQVIWLGNGIMGDDTHGHVDDISRFTSSDTVVTVVEPNKKEANHALLKENLKRLKAVRHSGKQLNVVELPMPQTFHFEEQLLPASYANFLIANKLVLVPTFNDVNDRHALNILADLFPKHDVIGINCRDFVWGLGTIHCASQQEPA